MTYGENTHQLREALAVLLEQHRIQQRLGGDGSPRMPVTTTTEERQDLGQLIRRYRASAMTWCHNALDSATPAPGEALWHDRRLRPARHLAAALARSTTVESASPTSLPSLPSLMELTTSSPYVLVDTWRQVARAAALGEHDFASTGMSRGHLALGERAAVARDAADVLRGLCVLDERYKLVPGWVRLPHRNWLTRESRACSAAMADLAAHADPAELGWTPSAMIEGSARPGIEGVLQAQHNQVVALSRLPNALNLRRVLHGQWSISLEAARYAAASAPELSPRWQERAATYRRLVEASRDIGGLAGGGGQAVLEGGNALSRLRNLPRGETPSGEDVRRLDGLFARTDARVVSVIEQGTLQSCYLTKLSTRRLSNDTVAGTIRPGHRYVPLTEHDATGFLAEVRTGLASQVRRATTPSTSSTPKEGREEQMERPQLHLSGRAIDPPSAP